MIKIRKKSIVRKFILNMIVIIICLIVAVSFVMYFTFINFYDTEIVEENNKTAGFIYNTVEKFVDGAYNVSAELVANSDVYTMRNENQTKVFVDCAERNEYIELIYAQKTDGKQTGRSQGELGDRSNRWWFKDMMANPRPFVSKSYYSVSTKMPCTSIFMPINDENKRLVGVLGVDIKLEYIQNLIEDFSDSEKGNYSFIIDGEGNVVAHPDSRYMEEFYNFKNKTKQLPKKNSRGESSVDENGDVITEEVSFELSDEYKKAVSEVLSGNTGNIESEFEGKDYYISYTPIPMKGDSLSWAVITMRDKDIALSVAYKVILNVILISVFIIIITTIFIGMLTKKITIPIENMVKATERMKYGNFKDGINYHSQNEIGALSNSLNSFISDINNIIGDIDYVLTEISKGNMTAKPKAEYRGDFKSIKEILLEISGFLNKIMYRINVSSDNVLAGAEKVFKTSEALFDGADMQAESINKLSDVINKLSTKIQYIDKSTKDARNGIEYVYNEINKCNEQLKNIAETMRYTSDSTLQLRNIIKTINDVSEQTNMLSLNASVEAARISKDGAGFAVIARDIKQLAEKSAKETKSSEEFIKETIEAVKTSTETIEETGQYLIGVVDKAKNMADAIRDISDISNEEVELIDTLSDNIEKISEVVKSNTEVSGRSSDAAKELSEQANKLKSVVRKFKFK